MADVTALIPKLTVERVQISYGIEPVPRSRVEIITEGNLPGAETMLQVLLEIRGMIGGPEKAKAEREAKLREFHNAPITYDGLATVRRPPTESVWLVMEA